MCPPHYFKSLMLSYDYRMKGEIMNLLNIEFKDRNGQNKTLIDFEAKYYLVVNTASKCGLATQFEGLEELSREFKDNGLHVIGFPSQQFENQEYDTAEEAYEYCKLNYGVSFDIMNLLYINGEQEDPLYTELKRQVPGDIKWNFTKFLIDYNGNVLKRFEPEVEPAEIREYLENLF